MQLLPRFLSVGCFLGIQSRLVQGDHSVLLFPRDVLSFRLTIHLYKIVIQVGTLGCTAGHHLYQYLVGYLYGNLYQWQF
jgi:hypothetical protein